MRFSTRLILASLLGLAGLSTNVDAHAKLVSPTAWNPQPSKSNTCGVAANANAANPQSFKKTVLGNTVDIQWTVVIGDGNGPITAKLDTTAKVNPTAADFTVNLAATNDFPNQQKTVGPYTVRFTIPSNIKCTGPDNTCTMRVASSSNWVACATIQLQSQQQVVTQPPVTQAPVVTQAPTTKAPTTKAPTQATPTNSGTTTQSPVVTQPPATDPPATEPPATQPPTTSLPTRDPTEYYPYASSLNTCQVASGLTTCKNINGQSVQLMGINLAAVEAQAIEQIEFDFNNPAVLERPNTVGCRQALTDLICAQMFPPCLSDATVVCTSTCQRVNNLCKPNATAIIDDTGATSTHAQLFDCTNTKLGFTANDADSNGNCPSVTTGVRPTTAPGTTQKPVSLSSTGRNHASSLQSSFTVVMGVVTVLLAFVARV